MQTHAEINNLNADFIHKPSGTPTEFPVPQFLSKERGELDGSLVQRLMTDLNPTLLESFLNITLAKGEAVVQPEGVLDDARRKTVAIKLAVSHR